MIKRHILDSQIVGVAFGLARAFGMLPVANKRDEEPAVKEALLYLDSPHLGGAVIAHATGLGKTAIALCIASFITQWGELHLENGTPNHRPMLVVTPAGPVCGQWADEIATNFPNLLLIIASSEDTKQRFSSYWVSGTAMREAPGKLDNWPSHLRYVFDKTDSRASRTVVLTSFESFGARTTTTEPDPMKEGATVYVSHWVGIFIAIFLDEGHRIRHQGTRLNQSIVQLGAPASFVLTATPVINHITVGELSNSFYTRLLMLVYREWCLC